MEHIGNIKIPLYKGLISLHFRESKAYLLTPRTCEKMLHTTNQPSIISCGHLGEVLHRGKCVIHFQSHFQHTKMKEEQYELAHDEQTHSLNSIQKWPAIATQWNGHVFVMGLTSPEHLGRPLTSKVH
jgi:hypothetical protein